MPPHILKLKTDCVLILLGNINTRLGLFNGTRMRVKRLLTNLIEAECLRTHRNCFIPRMPLTAEAGNSMPFWLQRLQFPIRLANAMTINKAQGQTLDRVGVYLPQPVFSHGQLNVAASRVRTKQTLMF